MREYMCKITINQEDEVVGQGIGTRPPNKEQMKTKKMTSSAYKNEGVNRAQKVRFYPFVFTGMVPRKGTGPRAAW